MYALRIVSLAIAALVLGPPCKAIAQSPSFSFVEIPSGTFDMGSPTSETGHRYDEVLREVTISTDFEMMTTEVTQYEWFLVMGDNPSSFATSSHCPSTHVTISGIQMCPDRPVERVSWNDVQDFIDALNAADSLTCYGLPSDVSGCFRLPTEAEWEYAARAGTTTPWSWGSTMTPASSYAWYGVTSGNKPQDVGTLTGNAYALHDVHGNVWEWVNDWYTSLPTGGTDPLGPVSGTYKVFRGGAYNTSSNGQDMRSARRNIASKSGAYAQVGFRLARNL
jgi:formylglycine-generating enzyme required for sulfatase activity